MTRSEFSPGSHDVVVIGAGIIGVCCAAHLAERGLRPLVIDRTGIVEETSSGNAAALAFSDVLPLAQKGMMRNLPRWLTDPLGPLSIRPAYLPKLIPWLYRFWRAGRGSAYEGALAAQASLMKLAEAEWLAVMERSGTRGMLRENGSLELYESQEEFSASLAGWSARDRFGIAYRHVGQEEIAEIQPGLSLRFVKGTFVPGWKTVSDPMVLGQSIWAYAERNGAFFRKGTVEALDDAGEGVQVTMGDGARLSARQIVVAAGAWSHRIARRLGERIPLETERGYNTTLPADAFDLKLQLIFSGHGFVVTPLATGIRVGGAVELAGLEAPPNYARSKAMIDKARKFMPGLKSEGGREWMGYRPSLPDSLPVIGRSSGDDRVYYAFGHGHLGLTQAAATARLIADLVSGKAPAIELAPFSPQRF